MSNETILPISKQEAAAGEIRSKIGEDADNLRKWAKYRAYGGYFPAFVLGLIDGTFDALALVSIGGLLASEANADFLPLTPEAAAGIAAGAGLLGLHRAGLTVKEEWLAYQKELAVIEEWEKTLKEHEEFEKLSKLFAQPLTEESKETNTKQAIDRAAFLRVIHGKCTQEIVNHHLPDNISTQALNEFEAKYNELMESLTSRKTTPNTDPATKEELKTPSSTLNTVLNSLDNKFLDNLDFCIKQARNAFGLASIITLAVQKIFEEPQSAVSLVIIAIGWCAQIVPRILKYAIIDRTRNNVCERLHQETTAKKAEIEELRKLRAALENETLEILRRHSAPLPQAEQNPIIAAPNDITVYKTIAELSAASLSTLSESLKALHETAKQSRKYGDFASVVVGFFEGAFHTIGVSGIVAIIITLIVAPPVLGTALICCLAGAAVITGITFAIRAFNKESKTEKREDEEFEKTISAATALQNSIQIHAKRAIELKSCNQTPEETTGDMQTYRLLKEALNKELSNYNQLIQDAKNDYDTLVRFYQNGNIDPNKFNQLPTLSTKPIEQLSYEEVSNNQQPPPPRVARDSFNVFEISLSALMVVGKIAAAWTVLGISLVCGLAITVTSFLKSRFIDKPRENRLKVLTMTQERIKHHSSKLQEQLEKVEKAKVALDAFRSNCQPQLVGTQTPQSPKTNSTYGFTSASAYILS